MWVWVPAPALLSWVAFSEPCSLSTGTYLKDALRAWQWSQCPAQLAFRNKWQASALVPISRALHQWGSPGTQRGSIGSVEVVCLKFLWCVFCIFEFYQRDTRERWPSCTRKQLQCIFNLGYFTSLWYEETNSMWLGNLSCRSASKEHTPTLRFSDPHLDNTAYLAERGDLMRLDCSLLHSVQTLRWVPEPTHKCFNDD